MAKRAKNGKAKKDEPQQEPEKKAGPELDAAHEAEVLHNLSGTVRDGFARLYEVEKELDAKTIKHLEPLRQDRKDAWAALKTDSGIQREELSLYYAIYKRIRDLDDFEDQDAAAIVKDNMRRVWGSLKSGETMNFLDAMETVQPSNSKEPPKSAYREGQRDHGIGMNFDQCPYPESDSVNREAWQSAWLKSDEEWKKHAPPGARPSAPVEPVTAH